MSALSWRDQQQHDDPDLSEALSQWQGCNKTMRDTMETIIGSGKEEIFTHVVKILKEMKTAPELPVNTVLWRATEPGTTIASKYWVAMSATMEGAEEYGRMHLGQFMLHKLVVASAGVRALAVNSSPEYEYEKEIIIAPDMTFEHQGPDMVDGRHVIVEHVHCH